MSMGVYINGMEMPKSCSVCPMLEGDRMDGLCHAASKWLDDDEHWTWYVYPEGDIDDSKPCNCPLVPVPPHGRLGDLDRLEKMFADIDHAPYSGFDGIEPFYSAEDAAQIIRLAPTIIPAEQEKSREIKWREWNYLLPEEDET